MDEEIRVVNISQRVVYGSTLFLVVVALDLKKCSEILVTRTLENRELLDEFLDSRRKCKEMNLDSTGANEQWSIEDRTTA
jgi:hypothetical protein